MAARFDRRFGWQLAGATAVALLVLTAAQPTMQDLWDVGHHTGDRMPVERPECPTVWDTIPLHTTTEVNRALELKDDQWSPALRRGFSRFLRTGSPTQTLLFRPPSGNIPAPGPITDIPEFHDCQRFVTEDGTQFDSLFAIFATFRMDRVVSRLSWLDVEWLSSDTGVASIDRTGLLRAKREGTTTVRARASLSRTRIEPSITIRVEGTAEDTTVASLSFGKSDPVTLGVGARRLVVSQIGDPTSTTLAAATIYSYGPGYTALGIGPNFSCLYVYFDASGQLKAKMVNVVQLQSYPTACLNAVNPLVTFPGEKALAVVRSRPGGMMAATDYPAVARWQWDPQTGKQFIGISCPDRSGGGWCEIGDPVDPQSRPFAPPDGYVLPAGAPAGDRRVIQIKGWHDEQFLAIPITVGSPDLKPSKLLGTVIPHPAIKQVTKPRLSNAARQTDLRQPVEWTPIAYVALRAVSFDSSEVNHYKRKLNLDITPVQTLGPGLNQMLYCYGDRDICEIPPDEADGGGAMCDVSVRGGIIRVWVKLVSATGDIRYFCVTRRGHPAFGDRVPGTTRWRWILKDDTVWTECVNGCCQTQGGQG
jgi:Bacterial Ig-like domain (group 2)